LAVGDTSFLLVPGTKKTIRERDNPKKLQKEKKQVKKKSEGSRDGTGEEGTENLNQK